MHAIVSEQKDRNTNFFDCPFAKKLKTFINSNYALAIISVISCFFWLLGVGFVTVVTLSVYVILAFIFCHDDLKALLLPVLSMSLMFSNLTTGFTIVLVTVLIVVAVLVGFLIYKIFIQKQCMKKGKLFWAYVLVLIANALAGIIGHFELRAFIITLGLGLLLYFLYWFALNFIHDYKKYFAYCLIFLALIVAFQLIVGYARSENLKLAFENKFIRVGSGQINGPALFIVAGIVASYFLATGSSKKGLKVFYFFVALFLDIVLLFTFSRMSLIVGAIANVIYLIVLFRQSNRKKLIITVLITILIVAFVLCVVFYRQICNTFHFYISTGLNGREDLWPWCFNMFKRNPIFGVGFITRDIASATGSTLPIAGNGAYVQIMAHNTILHYLTCTGVVGLILNIPFYIKKYQTVCSNFNSYKLFCLINVLCIEFASLMDTAGTCNLFNMILLYFTLGVAEKNLEEKNQNINNVNCDKNNGNKNVKIKMQINWSKLKNY